MRIVTVIENLPKSLFNFICIATRAKLICKLQFGLARPDFLRFLMVDLMVGCSRLLVLVNDWHVIGAFEPFCSNETKKFSFRQFRYVLSVVVTFLFLQNVKTSVRDQIQFDSVDITENATRIYIADCNTDNVLSCTQQNRRK